MLRTYTFPVKATCGSCVTGIEIALEDLGIAQHQITTDIKTQITTVTIEVTNNIEKEIKQALKNAAYLREEPVFAVVKDYFIDYFNGKIFRKYPWLHWVLGGIGIISGLAMLTLMILMPLGIIVVPTIMYALGAISAIFSLILGGPTILKSVKKLVNRQPPDMDTLFALGGTVAIIITILHLFIPVLPMIFDAALLLFGIQHLGNAIKISLTQSVTRKLTFKQRTPLTIEVETFAQPVTLDRIQPGSIIRVPRNSIIPLDGILLDDEAELYTTLFDGNTMPVTHEKNRAVTAGLRVASDNMRDYIRIKTTHTVQDSTLNQLDLKAALENKEKLKILHLTDKAIRIFIPAVIVLAILASIVIGILFTPAAAIICGLSILAFACPCSLGIIAPLATKLGMAEAEKKHATFKNERALQTAAQIDTVIFDWNGTATVGNPEVTAFYSAPDASDDLLSAICELESRSSHAMARAICRYGATKNISLGKKMMSTIERSHAGLSAIFDNKRLIVGNEKMMQQHAIDLSNITIHQNNAQHITYVAMDNNIVGYFVLEDPLRKGLKTSIAELRRLGIKHIGVLSGADDRMVQTYKEKLGFDFACGHCKNISTNAHEISKMDIIQTLQKEGYRVAMIGDGGNDFFPLKQSDLGIAIQSASSDPITTDIADVIVEGEALFPIVAIFETAKQSVANIQQNLYISLFSNVLMFGIAIAATLAASALVVSLGFVPAIGAALMIVLFGVVIANVYRNRPTLTHTAFAETHPDEAVFTTATLGKKLRNTFPSPQPSPTTDDSALPSQTKEEADHLTFQHATLTDEAMSSVNPSML